MHRNAALLHKQHRNDSCESRLYISFLCKWKFICVVEQILNASVYFTHMESFFFFTRWCTVTRKLQDALLGFN